MAGILSALHSPQLVASFQRLCGVNVIRREPDDVSESESIRGSHQEESAPLANGAQLSKRKVNGRRTEEPADVSSAKEVNFEITNKFLYYLFCFGSSLGNEVFYICFFSFWFWNVDGYVGRRLCFFWGLFMYLGQATKDLLKIPRPASPPVVRMEDRYALEYGMPSTHAMVGAGIPFGIYFLTRERYAFPSEVTLIGAVLWCTLVCCSRCYLGMHSVLDVLAGLIYVFVLTVVCFHWSLTDVVDGFVLDGGLLSLFVCLLVPLLLCLFYPASKHRWSTARGDTTIIVAVCTGQLLSHWLSYQMGLMTRPTPVRGLPQDVLGGDSVRDLFNASVFPDHAFPGGSTTASSGLSPPYPVTPLTWEWAAVTLTRTVLGLATLVVARLVIRAATLGLVCRLNGVRTGDQEAVRSLRVELPYKFITYSLLTVWALLCCPFLFRGLGMERETYFTEL